MKGKEASPSCFSSLLLVQLLMMTGSRGIGKTGGLVIFCSFGCPFVFVFENDVELLPLLRSSIIHRVWIKRICMKQGWRQESEFPCLIFYRLLHLHTRLSPPFLHASMTACLSHVPCLRVIIIFSLSWLLLLLSPLLIGNCNWHNHISYYAALLRSFLRHDMWATHVHISSLSHTSW
jgi:hypothetical protein